MVSSISVTRLPPYCALHPGDKRIPMGTGYLIVCQYTSVRRWVSMKMGFRQSMAVASVNVIPTNGRNPPSARVPQSRDSSSQIRRNDIAFSIRRNPDFLCQYHGSSQAIRSPSLSRSCGSSPTRWKFLGTPASPQFTSGYGRIQAPA